MGAADRRTAGDSPRASEPVPAIAPPRRADRLTLPFAPVFALLLLAAAALALAYRHPPLVDWPEHLAQDAIVGRLHDPAFGAARYYRTTGWFLPYQGFRWLHIALAQFLGYDLGARVALLGYLLGTPLALLGLARRLDRDPWLAVAALTLLVDANFLFGFAPHALGTTLLLTGLCLLIDFAQKGGALRGAGLALTALALFFTHAHQTAVFLLSAAAVGAVALARGAVSRNRALATAGLLLPAGVALAAYMLGAGWVSGAALHDGLSSASGPVRWNTPWNTLRLWAWSAGLTVTGRVPWGAYLAALGAAATVARPSPPGVSNSPVRPSPEGEGQPDAARRRAGRGSFSFAGPTLAAVWIAMLFALPGEFRGQTIAPRVASLALLGVLLALPWRSAGRRARGARAIVALAAAVSLGHAHARFARFARTMGGLDEALARIAPGSRVAALSYGLYGPGLELPVYLHLGGYAVAARGGMASSGFVRTGVTYRDEVPREVLTVRELWRPSSEGWQLDAARAGYYDYVLVRVGERYPGTPFAPGVAGGRRLMARDGVELWRTGGATADAGGE